MKQKKKKRNTLSMKGRRRRGGGGGGQKGVQGAPSWKEHLKKKGKRSGDFTCFEGIQFGQMMGWAY